MIQFTYDVDLSDLVGAVRSKPYKNSLHMWLGGRQDPILGTTTLGF